MKGMSREISEKDKSVKTTDFETQEKMWWREDIETYNKRIREETDRLLTDMKMIREAMNAKWPKKKPKLKTYRFFDHFTCEWVFVRGKNKYEAVQNAFGIEASRFIFKTFKVERVYND